MHQPKLCKQIIHFAVLTSDRTRDIWWWGLRHRDLLGKINKKIISTNQDVMILLY